MPQSSSRDLAAHAVVVAGRLDVDFDIPTVVGGVHCTMVPDEVTGDGHFDYVCVGEGEYAILELQSSSSWRLTAPFRAISKRLRRKS